MAPHLPRITYDKEGPYIIDNPTWSQAFYGRLHGQPQMYTITSAAPFTLHAEILVPLLPSSTLDFSLEIASPDGLSMTLPASVRWTRFDEPYSKTSYYRGGVYDQLVSAGTYTLTVSNLNNTGKYVLVTGSEEVFPPSEQATIQGTLDRLRREFFDVKPVTSWYMWFILILVILFICLLYYSVVKMGAAFTAEKPSNGANLTEL